MIQEGKQRQLMPVNLWSNCPVSAETFYNFGKPESNFQVFNYSLPKRGWKYFPKITLPMLAVLAENDFAVGKPAKTCLKLLKKATRSKNFETILIRNTNHAYQGKEELLAQKIVDWLRRI